MKIIKNSIRAIATLLIAIISTSAYSHISTVRITNTRNKPMSYAIYYHTYTIAVPGIVIGQPLEATSQSIIGEIAATSTNDVPINKNFELYSVGVWSPRGAGKVWPRKVNLSDPKDKAYVDTKTPPYRLDITITEKPHYAVGGWQLGETYDISHQIVPLW